MDIDSTGGMILTPGISLCNACMVSCPARTRRSACFPFTASITS